MGVGEGSEIDRFIEMAICFRLVPVLADVPGETTRKAS